MSMLRHFLLCLLLFSFPGCVKYYDLVKSEFPQGEIREDRKELISQYFRTAKMYDQFKTHGIFHILLLSDAVREAYVDDYSDRVGKNKNERDALLRQELNKNKNKMSFYVHMDARDSHSIGLHEKNSPWSLYLKRSDGKRLEPNFIKEVDGLFPEYQRYFGHRYNAHLSTYLVEFTVNDLSDNLFFRQKGEPFEMVVGSPIKSMPVSWYKKDQKICKKYLEDDDFYWC